MGSKIPASLLLFVLFFGGLVLAAGSWPANWILINTDPADQPAQRAPVDVVGSYYNFDSGYIYLRLNTVETPTFTPNPQRNNYYKWMIDEDNDAYVQGNQIFNTDYALMVRDLCDAGAGNGYDGVGEYYIFGPSNTSDFSDFGACSQSVTCVNCAPYKVNDSNVGEYRVVPFNIDMYVSWERLGGFGLNRSFWWATGHDASSNLNQIGNDNSPFGSNFTPFIPLPHLTLSKTPDPAFGTPGSIIEFSLELDNDGQANFSNVSITDFLPSQMTFSSCSDNCTVSGQDVWWNYTGLFVHGSSWTVFLNASINPGTPDGNLTNIANASGNSTYSGEMFYATDSSTITVGNVCGISVVPSTLEYGSLETRQTSSEVNATLNNTGTTQTSDLTIEGGNWWFGSEFFFGSQTHYYLESGKAWENMSALSSTPTTLGDGTLAPSETLLSHYKVRIPVGQAAGAYTQDITFTSTC